QVRGGRDEHVVVDDGAVQEGPLLHHDVAAEDGVLAQLDARLDLGVVADVQGPFQDGLRVDLGALGDPDAGRDLEPVQLDADRAGQHVGLRLQVALVGADVLPVAVGDVPVQRGAPASSSGNTSPDQSTGSPAATCSRTSGSIT